MTTAPAAAGGDDGTILTVRVRVDMDDAVTGLRRMGAASRRIGDGLVRARGMQEGDRYLRTLSRLMRTDIEKLAAIAAIGGPGGGPAGGSGPIGQGPVPRARDSRARSAFFAFGSEGMRMGHVRLSRSGLSLSEKTFLATPQLAMGAAAGQIAGTAMRGIMNAHQEYMQHQNLARFAAQTFLGAGIGVVRGGLRLFGIEALGAGVAALLGGYGSDYARGMERIEAMWDVVTLRSNRWQLAYNDVARSTAERVASQKRASQSAVARRASLLNLYPQDTESQHAAIEEMFQEHGRRMRHMIRDIRGRPVWRVANLGYNEGR